MKLMICVCKQYHIQENHRFFRKPSLLGPPLSLPDKACAKRTRRRRASATHFLFGSLLVEIPGSNLLLPSNLLMSVKCRVTTRMLGFDNSRDPRRGIPIRKTTALLNSRTLIFIQELGRNIVGVPWRGSVSACLAWGDLFVNNML